jgi:hypothetical protein
MPDPRQPPRPPQRPYQPQRPATPQPRQPPAPPQRGLIRALDPRHQAPPIAAERKLRKGESYLIVGHECLEGPLKGKVIRLSDEAGKTVGVEFAEPIGGVDQDGQRWGVVHDCDGRGRMSHCLYVRPDQALDAKAEQAFLAGLAAPAAAGPKFAEYDELTVGPQHSQPATPAGRETQTIAATDVGTLDLEIKDEAKEGPEDGTKEGPEDDGPKEGPEDDGPKAEPEDEAKDKGWGRHRK